MVEILPSSLDQLHVYQRQKQEKENEKIAKDLNEVEAKAESLAIEGMCRFDDTMKLVFQHCKQVLEVPNTGMKELNRLVEKSIIEKHATPSPLLKFYY